MLVSLHRRSIKRALATTGILGTIRPEAWSMIKLVVLVRVVIIIAIVLNDIVVMCGEKWISDRVTSIMFVCGMTIKTALY